jgi:RNA polymerase-binding transcription factor DksA
MSELGDDVMVKASKTLDELKRFRDHTLLDISRLKEELQAEIEPASATDDDAADIAADVYERGKITSLIQSMEVKLHNLEHAIDQASKGSYGVCESCGDPIPPERLAVMPETTLCVRCASKLEQGIRRRQILMADEEEEDRFSDDEDSDYENDFDDAGDYDSDL